MKKRTPKILFISLLGVLIGLLAWFFTPAKQESSSSNNLSKKESLHFFVPVEVVDYASSLMPCINIEIEGKKLVTGFDLGFDGYISLYKDYIENLSEKSFKKTRSAYGIRGTKHPKNVFAIPKIRIESLTFSGPLLDEKSESMEKEAAFTKEPLTSKFPLAGCLGFRLFDTITLFLDLKHRSMILCDSIETFKKSGPSLDSFAKVSLLTDHFIEFEAKTPQGPLYCILDTGCTLNLIHYDNPDHRPVEELIFDKEKFTKFNSFLVGEKDIGAITFRPFPFKLPMRLEAILGMEFLIKHKVFIDFKNKQLYFCRNED